MKKLFPLFLLLMTFASTWAANQASVINASGTETTYPTFDAAWKAMKSGETLKLLTDVELGGCYYISSDATFTINLNGKSIKSSSNYKDQYLLAVTGNGSLKVNNGTLRMLKSGYTETPNPNLGSDIQYACIGCTREYGSLRTESVTFEGNSVTSKGTFRSKVCDFKGITINGGTFNSDGDKIKNLQTLSESMLLIKNATIGYMLIMGGAKLNLNSCQVQNDLEQYDLCIIGAEATLTDCTFLFDHPSSETISLINSKLHLAKGKGQNKITNLSGTAISSTFSTITSDETDMTNRLVIEAGDIGIKALGNSEMYFSSIILQGRNHGIVCNEGELKISTDDNGSSVGVTKSDGYALLATGNGNITVEKTGRYFGNVGTTENGKMTLKGGMYNKMPPSKHIPQFYNLRALKSTDAYYDTGMRYIVEYSPAAYNKTKNIYYDRLSGAITGASENDVIELVKSVSVSGYYSLNKKGLTLDLCGNTITSASTSTSDCTMKITASGVTVKNGTIDYNNLNVNDSKVVSVEGNGANISSLLLKNSKTGVAFMSNTSKGTMKSCSFENISSRLLYVGESAEIEYVEKNNFSKAAGATNLIYLDAKSNMHATGNTYDHEGEAITLKRDAAFFEYSATVTGTGTFMLGSAGSNAELRNMQLTGKSVASHPIFKTSGHIELNACTINDSGSNDVIVVIDSGEANISRFGSGVSNIKTAGTVLKNSSTGESIIQGNTIIDAKYAIVAYDGTTTVNTGYIKGKFDEYTGASIKIMNGYFSENPSPYVPEGCKVSLLATNTDEYKAGYRYEVTDGPSAIEAVETANEADSNVPTFSTQGVRVSNNYRGIVIKNGKKYLQK